MSVGADARHLAGCGADVKVVDGESVSAWGFFGKTDREGVLGPFEWRCQGVSAGVILIAFVAGDK